MCVFLDLIMSSVGGKGTSSCQYLLLTAHLSLSCFRVVFCSRCCLSVNKFKVVHQTWGDLTVPFNERVLNVGGLCLGSLISQPVTVSKCAYVCACLSV